MLASKVIANVYGTKRLAGEVYVLLLSPKIEECMPWTGRLRHVNPIPSPLGTVSNQFYSGINRPAPYMLNRNPNMSRVATNRAILSDSLERPPSFVGFFKIGNVFFRDHYPDLLMTVEMGTTESAPRRARSGDRGRSLLGIRRHFLHHGEDQLAVAVIEVGGVAADLAEEADFVVRELRQSLGAVAVAGFGKELRERNFHGSGNFGQGVERGDGVAVLYARQVAAQQAGTFFDVSLRHAFLQPVVPNGFADVDLGEHCGCDIVTRSGFSGKWKLVP